jgi:hypothetical protein
VKTASAAFPESWQGSPSSGTLSPRRPSLATRLERVALRVPARCPRALSRPETPSWRVSRPDKHSISPLLWCCKIPLWRFHRLFMGSGNSVLALTAREPNAAASEFDAARRQRADDGGERLPLRLRLALFELADCPPVDAAAAPASRRSSHMLPKSRGILDGLSPWLPHAVPTSPSSVLIVSRAIRARALICLFISSPSAVKPPYLRAFLLPLGAPLPAPCIRQTYAPHRWSLARGPAPFRLGAASQRLVHIQEHEVEPPFFSAPLPPPQGH